MLLGNPILQALRTLTDFKSIFETEESWTVGLDLQYLM